MVHVCFWDYANIYSGVPMGYHLKLVFILLLFAGCKSQSHTHQQYELKEIETRTFDDVVKDIRAEYMKALSGERMLFCATCRVEYPVYYHPRFKSVLPKAHRIPQERMTCTGSFIQGEIE